ncbi:protein SSUH2 homolog isoform X2 [Lingula anatina]|uniref:Protein SSUH2 homolog isoform X2 n=1 Tax=Lingula anatina TaxID=7574 RepID=A0A1S3ISY1_LINAN|nr:protein SSUH2 homolog isoform X2 [Lingula anatina]|eukprot:XP_013400639.1 protein SSUH2 homolog isoform X2 [Lingula anatina]
MKQVYAGPPPGQGYAGPPPGQGYAGPPPGQGYAGPPPGQGYAGLPPGQGYTGPPPGQAYSGPPPGQGMPPQQGIPPQGQNPPYNPQQMPGAPAQAAPSQWQPGQGGAYTPNDDDDDDDEKEGPPPPAPTLMFEHYSNIGTETNPLALPPPAAQPYPPQGDPPRMDFSEAANISAEQAREALLQYVAEQCCYGSGTAKDMLINSIAPSSALHYTLSTFAEARKTFYDYDPFRGQHIDGPQYGQAPMPWQIPCEPQQLFLTHTKYLKVPHTSDIIPCFRCQRRGWLRCGRCRGRGQVRCNSCGGDGRKRVYRQKEWQDVRCGSCGGDGRKRCLTCGGDGRVTCSKCKGYRDLERYVKLAVIFTNHIEDYILEETDMPDELVRDVGGIIIFEQVLPQVWPVTQYPVPQINQNSVALVEKHSRAFPNERQLMQKQELRAVPVSEVNYTWKEVNTRFWVYGNERQVYAPDYPQQCCWGCEIL